MELKDVILSTLAEMEEQPRKSTENERHTAVSENTTTIAKEMQENVSASYDDERQFLDGIRERLLVLFEGFQSPNNVQIEAKVDLTLNFLEYLLATIDNRIKNIK